MVETWNSHFDPFWLMKTTPNRAPDLNGVATQAQTGESAA